MLSDRHKNFLLIEQGVIPTILNFFINGFIAWILFRSMESVPLWGASSIGIDLLATAFLLPFITCLIVNAVVQRQLRSHKIPPLLSNQLPLSGWFRHSALVRGSLLGTSGVIFAAIPIVLVLDLAEAQPITVTSYVIYKAFWATLLAMIVSPLIGWWALANASYNHEA